MKIPLVDLKRQYESIRGEIDSAIQNVLTTTSFVGGPIKENFERAFARACGAKHCIGVGNGTDSLMLTLKAAGIGPGDEVLVPANSFIATSEMVTAAGATPVFVDCDEETFNIDLNRAEALLEKHAKSRGGRIRAMIPVHLYGRICDMDRVMSLAKTYDLFVLEDSAQAHLAKWNGRTAGSWGHAGSFSFYPGKNLGAYGDGGAVTCNDDALAERIRKLANHGRISKYDHDIEGFNSRLDTLQAAVLSVKLNRLERWTEARQNLAHRYDELLRGTPNLKLPALPPRGQHVFHLYVVRVPRRNDVLAALKEKGIEAGIHYPIALPLLKAYERFGFRREDFPIAAKLQDEILSLPLFPEMTGEEQDYIVTHLREALSSMK